MNWNNKRVFVTGGTGFIGSHLVNWLSLQRANLGVFIHSKDSHVCQIKHYGDLRERSNGLRSFLDYFQPEIIFHLAAQAIVRNEDMDETDTIMTNTIGTMNLLRSCKKLDSLKSFVHISTDKVFGNLSVISKESLPHGPGHPYNASKAAGEQIAQMYSNYFEVPMVVIRNANVYGSGDIHFDRIIPRTIRKVFNGERPVIRGDGSNTRDYLHVGDIIDGYVHAAELPYKNNFTTLNLGGFNHSVVEVVDKILERMNRIDISPIFEEQWKGEIPNQHIERDMNVFNWSPKTSLDIGLEKTIPWYMEYLNEH